MTVILRASVPALNSSMVLFGKFAENNYMVEVKGSLICCPFFELIFLFPSLNMIINIKYVKALFFPGPNLDSPESVIILP